MTPAQLADLHASAFEHSWSAAEFASLLAAPGILLAHQPGGFVLARQIADEAEILTLAVAPASRRQGVGAHLIEQAAGLAAARGAVRLFLEVAIDNLAAQRLYAAANFIEIGRRRGYYSRPGAAVDAVVLARDL